MALFSTLQDNFIGPALNTNLWTQFTGGSATFVYDTSGVKVVYPVSTTSATDGDLTSNSSYDLTGSSVLVNVLDVPDVGAVNTDASMIVGTTTNGLRILVEGGQIYAQKFVGGAQTNLANTTYSRVTHAWWRIRETAGTSYWETSPNGTTWTVLFSATNPITVTSLVIQLAGTAFGSSTSPGNFKWRNFNLPPSQGMYNHLRVGDGMSVAGVAN
jgi:hypothetical protein